MARLGRPGSDAQRRELWERWKAGDSISEIGRALFKHPGSVHGVLALGGGIYRPERKRADCALTTHEREQISRGLAAAHSCRQIAAELGRVPGRRHAALSLVIWLSTLSGLGLWPRSSPSNGPFRHSPG